MTTALRAFSLFVCWLAVFGGGGDAHAQTLAAGGQHTVVVAPDASVWTWGVNGAGQLGDGTYMNRAVPTQVPLLTGVTAVAAGAQHTLALKSDGSLWAWGSNGYGSLGDGSTTGRSSPVPVTGISNVVAIAAGDYHSVALTSDGRVWTWGANFNGQLGDGTTTLSKQPIVVSTTITATAIGAGPNHTLLVKSDGSVWAWGANGNGQLGDGSTTQRTTPVQMTGVTDASKVAGGGFHSLVLKTDGTVRAVGNNQYGQLGDASWTQRTASVVVSSLSNVSAIAAGTYHSYAFLSDGTMRAWGYPGSGRLGDGQTNTWRNTPVVVSTLASIATMASGQQHGIAVSTAGVVWTWGENAGSRLGDGTTQSRSTPAPISGPNYAWKVGTPVFSVAADTYTTEKTVVITCATPDAVIHYTLNGAEPTEADPMIASGGSVPIVQSGTLKARAWKTTVPTSEIGSAAYTLAVNWLSFSPGGGTYTTSKTVTISTTTPGATIRYTLDGTTPNETSAIYTAPLNMATSTTVKAIGMRANWTSSFVATHIYTMNFGTLASPSADPAGATYEGQVTVTLSAAAGTTIRYTTDGSEPTASSTAYSQPLVLGVTTTLKAKAFHPDYAASPTTSQVYTVRATTPALSLPSGTYAPGESVTVSSSDPGATIRITLTGLDPVATDPAIPSGTSFLIGGFTLKARAFKAGNVESTVVAATYGLTEPLGPGALSAGGSHTTLATPQGLLYGWGLGTSGQIGDGTTVNRSVPTLVQTLTGVKAVASGTTHTLALTYDGRLFAWGSNGSGRLGDGTTTNRSSPVHISALSNVVAIAAGDSHSLALTADGVVHAWGAGTSGVLGLGSTTSMLLPTVVPSLSNIVAIAAGGAHSLAVSSTGAVYAWGWNGFGQLGDGTSTTRMTPTLISGIAGAASVAAGTSFSAARLQTGAVYVWGDGGSGQLGLGNTANRTTPTLLPDFAASAIAAGGTHTVALRSDGVLMAWGANTSGQVGDTTTTMRTVPTVVSGSPVVAMLAAGNAHSVAVSPDGDVWTWGAGGSGQLGEGTLVTRATPQQVATMLGTWGATSAPVLSVGSGVYHSAQTVTVSNPMNEAVMRYTTSGDEPTESDAVIASGSQIVVDRTLTLRVRAWSPGLPPSHTVSATLTLQPLAPVIAPAGGNFNGPQTVTMSTATSGAAIRYTLDGIEPTADSQVYSGPITVATLTTVKARAFVATWSPSATSAATLLFEYGMLQTPAASSGSGTYAPNHVVSLTSADGGTIRYTLDGSEPTQSSAIYTGPLGFAAGLTTLKARAFKTDWAPSSIAAWTYQITNDLTPPTITAQVSPAANANGWHKTDVTITFTCTDAESGVASCPSPVTIDYDGSAITIAREAVDLVGNRATSSVVLNVDRTAPILTLHTPAEGDVVPLDTATLEVRGNAVDGLSGIASVTCNGATATIDGQRYTCSVPVTTGLNPIHIVATDLAGNAGASDVQVNVDNPPPPTSIQITPAKMTLIPGETRQIGVVDQRGRPVTGGSFSVANALIAQVEVDADNVPFVRGIAGGETTVTLTREGLVAEATVTVLPDGTITVPAGTPLWALPNIGDVVPLRGRVVAAGENPSPELSNTAAFYFIDEGTQWIDGQLRRLPGQTTVIRAATFDGRELWRWRFTDRIMEHVAADNNGGLVVVFDAQLDNQNRYHPAAVRRLDGATGRVSWEHVVIGSLSKVAVHPDGRVFTSEYPYYGADAYLTAIDTGGGVQKVPLPKGHSTRFVDGVMDIDADTQSEATPPIVLEDGTVLAVSHVYSMRSFAIQDPNSSLIRLIQDPSPDRIAASFYRSSITVTELRPGVPQPIFHDVDITAAAQTYFPAWLEDLRVPISPSNNVLLPDGTGGLLLGDRNSPRVHRIVRNGEQDYLMAAPAQLVPWTGTYSMEYLLGEDGVHALALGGSALPNPNYWAHYMIFDPQTLALEDDGPLGVSATTPKQLQLQFAVAGGGSFISGPTDGYLVNASVSPDGFVSGGLATEAVLGHWNGWLPEGPGLVMGSEPARALTAFPYTNGNAQGGNAAPIRTYVHLQFKADWDNSLRISGFTDSELAAVRETARTTVEEAFKGYAVSAIVGTLEDARVNKYNRRIFIDGLLSQGNGDTFSGRLSSEVHMGTLFLSFKSAFDCGQGQDCKQTDFSEMPQKTGFSRAQLITALGRGTGATAAHEMGHQVNPFVGVRSFTFHTTTCGNCYDYYWPGGNARFPRDYFLGPPLKWTPEAQKEMPRALPR